MRQAAALCALLVLAGCGGKSYVKKGEIQQTIEQQSFQKAYIESIGIGAADSTLTNATQRRALSRDAAIVKAQYEMLSMIKGLQLTGGITVEQAMATDSNLQTSINSEIKAAEVVKSEWTNDDGCLVTLRLYKKRINELLNGQLLGQ
jgi:hypothetical protein